MYIYIQTYIHIHRGSQKTVHAQCWRYLPTSIRKSPELSAPPVLVAEGPCFVGPCGPETAPNRRNEKEEVFIIALICNNVISLDFYDIGYHPVSIYGGFLKWGYPECHHPFLDGFFHYKPSIFGKPP